MLPLNKTGDRRQAIAISLVRLGVDDIPVTPGADDLSAGSDFEDENSNGSWDPGERLFLSPDQFQFKSSNDWGLLFSYSQPVGSKLAVGGNLKMIYRTLPGGFDQSGNSAYGAGLDAGLTYQMTNRLGLAFVAKDFTTTYMVWNTDSRERISPNFVLGGQYTTPLGQMHMLTFALDVPFNFDGQTVDQRFGPSNGESGLSGTFNVGAEYWYHNHARATDRPDESRSHFWRRPSSQAHRRGLRRGIQPLLQHRGGRLPGR